MALSFVDSDGEAACPGKYEVEGLAIVQNATSDAHIYITTIKVSKILNFGRRTLSKIVVKRFRVSLQMLKFILS